AASFQRTPKRSCTSRLPPSSFGCALPAMSTWIGRSPPMIRSARSGSRKSRCSRLYVARRRAKPIVRQSGANAFAAASAERAGPRLTRDVAVARGAAVRGARAAQGGLGDAERLALVVHVRAPEADERPDVGPRALGQPLERRGDLLGRVGVVARRHRRVRGED